MADDITVTLKQGDRLVLEPTQKPENAQKGYRLHLHRMGDRKLEDKGALKDNNDQYIFFDPRQSTLIIARSLQPLTFKNVLKDLGIPQPSVVIPGNAKSDNIRLRIDTPVWVEGSFTLDKASQRKPKIAYTPDYRLSDAGSGPRALILHTQSKNHEIVIEPGAAGVEVVDGERSVTVSATNKEADAELKKLAPQKPDKKEEAATPLDDDTKKAVTAIKAYVEKELINNPEGWSKQLEGKAKNRLVESYENVKKAAGEINKTRVSDMEGLKKFRENLDALDKSMTELVDKAEKEQKASPKNGPLKNLPKSFQKIQDRFHKVLEKNPVTPEKPGKEGAMLPSALGQAIAAAGTFLGKLPFASSDNGFNKVALTRSDKPASRDLSA